MKLIGLHELERLELKSCISKRTTFILMTLMFGIFSCKSQEISSNPYRADIYKTGIFAVLPDKAAKQIFKTSKVGSDFDCLRECLSHPDCQSFNFQTTGNPSHLCELSKDFIISSACVDERPGYTYYYPAKNDLPKCPYCKNGGTCESTCRGDICKCQSFNKGHDCTEWTVPDISSCKDILTKTGYRANMAYTYTIDSKPTNIYCHLTDDICGVGGWTMVIKIDGSDMAQFGYTSALWSNKETHNMTAGQTGFDNYQTKMPSYWAMPFQKLCVGFKVNNVLRWTVIPYSGTSLLDVIAPGTYKSVSTVTKATWKTLISTGSFLQSYCNQRGFNVYGHARIGIRSNNENDCGTCDSALGFGLHRVYSCGNYCLWSMCGTPDKKIMAYGYIMLQ